MPRRLERTVITALAAVLAVLGVVGWVAYASVDQLISSAASVARTERVLRELEATYSAIADAETGSRGYVLTGERAYVVPYETAMREIAVNLPELRALASESPAQRARLVRLDTLVQRRLAVMREAIARRDDGGLPAALAVIRTGRGKALMDSVRALIDGMQREEEARLAERSRAQRVRARQVTSAIGAGLLLSILISVAAALVMREDLALRARAERGLREAKEAAEAANREKSDFLARMSHELRTPLNSVIGFSNVLRRTRADALGPQGRTYLERIHANGLHLLSLINDLLDIARIEAGRVNVERRPVALDALVREVAGGFEEEARSRGLALAVELPEALPPVETDPVRLKQVLVNLVGNALKFTEQGGVTVRVLADAATGVARQVEVVDTGIGIPPERQAAVFEAFEQADTGTARRFGGTGLGLAISRALCELLGHRLTLRSAMGVGSTFTIDLGVGAPQVVRTAEHAVARV